MGAKDTVKVGFPATRQARGWRAKAPSRMWRRAGGEAFLHALAGDASPFRGDRAGPAAKGFAGEKGRKP